MNTTLGNQRAPKGFNAAEHLQAEADLKGIAVAITKLRLRVSEGYGNDSEPAELLEAMQANCRKLAEIMLGLFESEQFGQHGSDNAERNEVTSPSWGEEL